MSHKIHLKLQLYTNLNCPVKATLTDLRHQGHYSRDKKEKIKKNSFHCWITEMLSHIPRHLLRKALNTFRFFGHLTAYPFWDLTAYPCAFSTCTLFIKTKEVEVQRNIWLFKKLSSKTVSEMKSAIFSSQVLSEHRSLNHKSFLFLSFLLQK